MPPKDKNKKERVVIIGAGIAGLAAAHYFSQNKNYEVLVVEKQKEVGGLARGFSHVFEGKEFKFDFGPHKIYTELPGIVEEMNKVTPLIKVKKKNTIFLKGTYFNFPLSMPQILAKMPMTALKAGFEILKKPFNTLQDDSYENFLINRFGRTLYSLSFKDYAEKVWNTNAKNLDKELAIRRVAVSNIFQLIKSALLGDNKKISAEFFHYPPKGLKQLSEGLLESIKKNGGKVMTNTQVSEIKVVDGRVDSVKINGKKIKADYVISSIYLDYLMGLINDSNASLKSASSAAAKLAYQPVSVLYLILNKERAMKDCWVFFPEKKYLFQRVSEQKAFSPYTCPPGMTGLMVETTKEPTEENIKIMISQLESVGLVKGSDIKDYFIKTGPRVYPVYLKGFLKHLNTVLNYSDSIKGLYTLGRPGRFNYNNTDHSWDMAWRTYEHIVGGEDPAEWEMLKLRFDKYRIVD